ncbi:MAG: 1-deoxy-D-xylulose-5-phosphate reductoisomerase [Bacteroidales bacterium]|jgi:1-deoxy-D-xylulose-5-phosphate reductoisomerase|nr:1-deoxy-D-xylulose-5-phosphate reductoisomerase [Bacteroidales bacterium]
MQKGRMPKRIALLGSTGSIGTQTLDVISRYPDEFLVEVLTAGNNVKLLVQQALKFHPDSVVIGNSEHYHHLREALKSHPVKVYAGEEAIEQVVAGSNVDMVVAAMVGYSGLRPTISAIRAGKKIALANKETLVVAGEIIKKLVKESGAGIIPVDSEHSAIFQCLAGERGNPVEKITLTASGGPFLNYTTEMLRNVKPHEALKHPNWEMGNKVTIDSASLMNKGLEVIEAKWLFDLYPEQIEVIVHPQSVIHSFVHFADGSVKAQLGIPDMRVPILYALSYPDRYASDLPKLDLRKYPELSFIPPDKTRFRNLALAYEALDKGGNMPCIMNAANEIAVHAFLSGKIGFLQMSDVVEYTMEKTEYFASPGLKFLETSNSMARSVASKYINELCKKS